jgi:glutamate dehydrogenase
MDPSSNAHPFQEAITAEARSFEQAFRWLEEHMPKSFQNEIALNIRLLIARNLLSFSLQDHFSLIHIKETAFVLCFDSPDADLLVLNRCTNYAIRYYRTFKSNAPPLGETKLLRITWLHFFDVEEEKLSSREKAALTSQLQQGHPNPDLENQLPALPTRFIRSLTQERLRIALDLFVRAKTKDSCQYDLKRHLDWQEKEAPSLQLVLAWKNVPKSSFLYRLAKVVQAHHLAMQKVVATYIDPYSPNNILLLSLGLHGRNGKAAWEEANLEEFVRELCLLHFFEDVDDISLKLVQPKVITGNEGHLVRNFISFVHQALVPSDPNLYSLDHIVEGFCRHPELTAKLCAAFALKFHPTTNDIKAYTTLKSQMLPLIEELDTGQAAYDTRRRHILKQALFMIDSTLKTNFYLPNKTAFAFRLSPDYLQELPYDRRDKFPELPYGIFFIRGLHFLGFHVRFKDLARGGVRTIYPERMEQYHNERTQIFSEAYHLAYTQQKKNKDIPEGGAKPAILLKPFEVFNKEVSMFQNELQEMQTHPALIHEKVKIFNREHKQAFLQRSQRSFIQSFMSLINCDDAGNLKETSIVDYWKRPEYIYLGPDENMSNEMICWIVDYAEAQHYKPKRSFMTSKPKDGINHKEFGVTSYGINVYLHEILIYLGIDPDKDSFTVKISGGPDGDVAGNQILNLQRFYPKTAKLVALTDVSGTIYDPEGLDLNAMADLFHQGKAICHYPHPKLHLGGYLLDLTQKKESSAYAQQTLCWKNEKGTLVEHWISGNEMNHLFRTNVHQAKADVFIPAGGRPRTLNELNYQNFLDTTGRPTAKAIVEGANLYLTAEARKALEKLGVLILKDSSCNKGGVICSSFEVLAGLVMEPQSFLQEKPTYVQEVLEIIKTAALNEVKTLLKTHREEGGFLTDISEAISKQINLYKYQILDYLESIELPKDPNSPLIQVFLQACPPLLKIKFRQQLFQIPPIHQKAMIACYVASHLVYTRGVSWHPNVADLLPTLLHSIIHK